MRMTRVMGIALVAGLASTAAPISVEAQERDRGEIVERITAFSQAVAERLQSALARLGIGDGEVSANPGTQEGDFTWVGRVARGDVVEIKGTNGTISAVPSEGDRVEVRATKRGRDSDPSEVRIEVLEHDEGVTVCAVYPSRRGNNFCGVGNDGRNNVNDNDVVVDFVVAVPAGARFVGRSVNGDVEALDLESDVEASTVNGGVMISTSGFAEASTVNGSIRAKMGRMARGLNFETVNGSIELDLPDDIDADLDASWVNGGLETDIPLRTTGRIDRHRARGMLGDGGAELELSTVNGSIRIY